MTRILTVKMTTCEENPNSKVFIELRGTVAIRKRLAFYEELEQGISDTRGRLDGFTLERLENYWGDEPDDFLSIVDEAPGLFFGFDSWALGSPDAWAILVDAHDGECLYCGDNSKKLQADHVDPRARGGGDESSNIAPACYSCNASKSAHPLKSWLARRQDLDPTAILFRWQAAGRPGDLGLARWRSSKAERPNV